MKRTFSVSVMVLLLFGLAAVTVTTTGCGLNGFREIILALNSIPTEAGTVPRGSLSVINDLLAASTLVPKPTAVTTSGATLGAINGVAADVFNGTLVSDTGNPADLEAFQAGDQPINGRIIAVDVLGAASALNITGILNPRNVHIGFDGNSLVFFDRAVVGDDDRSPDRAAGDDADNTGIFTSLIGAAGLAGMTRTQLNDGKGFKVPVDFDVELLSAGGFIVSDPGFGAEDTDDPATPEDERLPTGAILRAVGNTVTTVHQGVRTADTGIRDGAYGSIAEDAIGTIAVVNSGVDPDGNIVLQILSIVGTGAPTTLFEQSIDPTAEKVKDQFVPAALGQIEFGFLGNILAIRSGVIQADPADPTAEDTPAFQLISIVSKAATDVTKAADITDHTSGGFVVR